MGAQAAGPEIGVLCQALRKNLSEAGEGFRAPPPPAWGAPTTGAAARRALASIYPAVESAGL